ncbi:MAG: ferrous iron transporter B, partial [Elusimicrobia bacterium]|nr:ferrous iron transporter B [Elusimicrobiota bacterium]
FIGEGLIGSVFEPLFENLWAPLMLKVSSVLGSGGFIHDVLIGKLVEGGIDFGESFGVLTTGIFVPFGAVLPYVFAFYLILGLLEDSGYLPRLGVLVDNFMHKLGLHGLSIIPMLLGIGCNVPGALATRVLETKRERFIAATLMAIAVPCMAQIAMVVGLIGKFGAKGLVPVFGTLFVVWIILGVLQNLILKGESPEIFVEIPPYRIPYWGALVKKTWMRIKWFIKEAVPFVMLGVFIVNVLYVLGIIEFIGGIAEPVIKGVLGLPKEAVGALIVGFLRKDVAVGMLVPLGLTMKQLIIASVVLTMYFPCIATFAVMVKELGVKDMLKATLIMIVSTLLVGGFLNLVL